MTRPPEQVAAALEQFAAGATDREISVRLGVPYETVRNWRRRDGTREARHERDGTVLCRCGEPAHDLGAWATDDYAYLLGLYLGDGCLSDAARTVSLRVTLDVRYPGIVEACRAAIEAVRNRPPYVRAERTACVTLVSYWKSWPCLFPQHRPGRKHHRPIVLADWQREIVRDRPSRCSGDSSIPTAGADSTR